MKIIKNYDLKNKKLKRLRRWAWWELALQGQVSEETKDKIEESVGCKYCEWYSNEHGKVSGADSFSCTKAGIKEKKNALVSITLEEMMVLPYCSGFKER